MLLSDWYTKWKEKRIQEAVEEARKQGYEEGYAAGKAGVDSVTVRGKNDHVVTHEGKLGVGRHEKKAK